MKYFSDDAVEQTRKAQVNANQIRLQRETQAKNFEKARDNLIKDLLYGFRIFEIVVKEYPQYARAANITPIQRTKLIRKGGLFTKDKVRVFDLLPVCHHLGVYECDAGLDSNLYVDLNGTLMCVKEEGNKSIDVFEYREQAFSELLQSAVKPNFTMTNYHINNKIIECEDRRYNRFVSDVIDYIFGPSKLILKSKNMKESENTTITFPMSSDLSSILAKRLSDDQIAKRISDALSLVW